MLPKAFLLSLFFVVTALLANPAIVAAQSAKHAATDVPTEILRLVNEHRAGMGLGALKMNPVITAAAEKHSHNMATKKVPFGHDGFDARMDGITKQLKGANAWAENVAYGPQTAAAAVDMWLHSPGHKKNIEGDYNLTGIGIVKGADGELYYTQIFVYKN